MGESTKIASWRLDITIVHANCIADDGAQRIQKKGGQDALSLSRRPFRAPLTRTTVLVITAVPARLVDGDKEGTFVRLGGCRVN